VENNTKLTAGVGGNVSIGVLTSLGCSSRSRGKESFMAKRMPSLLGMAIIAALLSFPALLSGAAVAQTSPPFYINREYRFAIIFPGEPMARDTGYTTSSGASVPARQFYVEQGNEQFIMTVVDFSAGPAVDNAIVDHAAEQLRRRGEVRFQFAEDYDPGLPGRQLNVFESDGRQLRASVYMWDHRLYITEARAAPGSSAALQFEQSITILGADGNELNLDAAAFGQGP
jgi:hypothetical protein